MIKRISLAGAPADGPDLVVPAAPASARRLALHRLIVERGFISVADVAREIGISDMTVRRDMEVLERDGLIQRSHGGAMPTPATTVIPTEPSYAARRDLNRSAKQCIAATAAGLVAPDQAIGLDAGSTVAYLAAELATFDALEIVTNSLQTILAMPQPILPEVFCSVAGFVLGRVRCAAALPAGSLRSIGWIGSSSAFLEIDEKGVYDYSPEDIEIKAVFMQQAKVVTALCDSSKFGRRSFVRICDSKSSTVS